MEEPIKIISENDDMINVLAVKIDDIEKYNNRNKET